MRKMTALAPHCSAAVPFILPDLTVKYIAGDRDIAREA
jgi:hypothetical protein